MGIKVAITGAALALSTFIAGMASAQTVLTFEGLGDEETVLNYYNGGLGGSGSGPGPNFGITFSASSLSLIERGAGGSGNFHLEPSFKTGLFFLSTGAATMNVPAGFTTGFSFFYAAPNNPGVINVWSGPNATGTLLATLNLPTTTNGAGVPACAGNNFCPFVPIGVSFSGVAQSVDFGGTANQIVFDDVTIGSVTPGGGGATLAAVPTLGTWAFLLLIGLMAIASIAVIRRKQRRD